MKHYLVKVTVNDPYPKHYDYREEASSIGVAIARGLRKFRALAWKGRPLKEVSVSAHFIATTHAD